MMTKRLTALLAAAFVFILLVSAWAAPTGQRVFDNAGLFTEQEISEAEGLIAAVREKHGMDIVVLTIDDAEGKSSMDYADDYYDNNGFGTGDDNSGVLLLVDMDNREVHISTCGQAIRYLTDARIDVILDAAVAQLADGRYYNAAVEFLSYTDRYFSDGIPGGQYNYDTETGAVSKYRRLTATHFVVALLLGLAAGGAFFGITVVRYQKRAAKYTYPLRENASLELTRSDDVLVNSAITTRVIETRSGGGSSGSSGRSSTHRSSSGRRHGGGGRRF